MELDALRWALRGTAAYRHVVEEAPLRRVLALLDKLAAGDGAGAAEDYAGLFYLLRAEGSTSLGAWLDGHADDYPQAFRDAYAARVFDTCHVAARYLFEIPEEDVERYRDALDPRDRIDFDLRVLHLHRAVKDVYDEMEGSRTYRLGRVFLAFPSWVKSRVVLPKAKPRDEG